MVWETCKKCRKEWDRTVFHACPYCGYEPASIMVWFLTIVAALGVLVYSFLR